MFKISDFYLGELPGFLRNFIIAFYYPTTAEPKGTVMIVAVYVCIFVFTYVPL